jgi:hypothetical protein
VRRKGLRGDAVGAASPLFSIRSSSGRSVAGSGMWRREAGCGMAGSVVGEKVRGPGRGPVAHAAITRVLHANPSPVHLLS